MPQFRQTIDIRMYNLEELNRKEKEELLNIANELGIKNAEKMDDLTLRLTIIDEQATNFASSAVTNEKSGRKRSRVSIKSVDRVYTANQDKAKKVDSVSEKECKLTVGEVMVEPTERLDGDVEYQSPVDTVIIEKDPETIKKRTAPFKTPKKEKEEMTVDEVILGNIDGVEEVIKAPENTDHKETEIFGVVEQMPYFPGGTNALVEYMEENIKYPEDCEEVCIQGRVVITFVVEKDGSISDAKVVRSVYPSLDEEALRVVNGMPKWCPGKQNGQSVRTKYTIPVTFRLK